MMERRVRGEGGEREREEVFATPVKPLHGHQINTISQFLFINIHSVSILVSFGFVIVLIGIGKFNIQDGDT